MQHFNVLKITAVQTKTSLFSREVKTVPPHLSELLKLKKAHDWSRVIWSCIVGFKDDENSQNLSWFGMKPWQKAEVDSFPPFRDFTL